MKIPKQLENPDFRFIKIGFDKRATENGWNQDNNYTYNHSEFIKYLKNTEYGYGICCGFGNLAVIDCDSAKFGKLIKDKLPATFTVRTGGGGLHLYYIIKDLDKKKIMYDKDKKHLGEVQWQGQYVVGVNSPYTNSKKGITIEDGVSYDIIEDLPIKEITTKELLEVINPYLKKNEEDTNDEKGEYDISQFINLIEDAEEKDGVYRGTHPVHGSENGKNFEIDTNKNIWHCYRCESGGDALNLIAVLEGVIDCNKSKKGCLKGKKFRKVAAIAKEKYGLEVKADILVNAEILDNYRVLKYNKWGVSVNAINLAKLIINEEKLKLLVVNNEANGTCELYYYNEDGYYDPEGKLQIRRFVNKYLESLSCENTKREVIGWISDLSRINRSELEPDPKLINFKNGVLNIETGKLTGHDSEQTFLNQIPWNYDPKADCPKIKKFFNDILDVKYIPLLQEIFGYTLYRKYVFARLFIFFGSGRNGKGVTLNLMRKMLGVKNISSRKIHELLSDRFAAADLYCTMANIAGEMNYEDLNKTDIIKELTGSDFLTAQKKNRDAFQFLNYAKLVFNTNSLPFSHDKSIAFYDRICLIKFLKKFSKDNPKTDPFIFEKISTNEEMEGLIVWAVDGLKRLLKHQKFSAEMSADEIGDEYEDSVNTEGKWLEDNFKGIELQKKVSFENIYDKYVQFCNDNNFPFVTKQRLSYLCKKIFKSMNQRCICKVDFKKDKNRKTQRYTYFYGISWKDDNE